MFMCLLAGWLILGTMIRNVVAIAFSALFLSAPVATSTPAAQSEPSADWKLPFSSPHQLARQYLQPTSDYSAGHRGVDYLVTPGEIIYAPSAGNVNFSGRLVNRSLVSIRHPGGFVTEFEPICSDLRVGDDVLAGQPIGSVCEADGGYAQHCPNAICLHFSLRLNGNYLSPFALIGGLNPSRLLPYDRK